MKTIRTSKFATAFLLSLAFLGVQAFAQDDANHSLEERFHKIFKEYNEKPTSETSWGQAFGSVQARTYEVMESDTLWDISSVLFADSFFWPKIWSFNADILNPHEIKPGWIVRFFPGTLETPPSLVVTEFEGVELPPPKPPIPIAQIPPSLPMYVPETPNYKPPEILKTENTALTVIPPLPLPVEILSERPEIHGQVVEVEDGARLATETRELFIRIDEERLPKGQEEGLGTYTVIRQVEKIKKGFIVQYRGEVKILEKINDSESIYRAQITKFIDSIEVGDSIVPGLIPMVDVADVPISNLSPLVRIVGGYRSPTDSLFAPFSIVFLEGGISEGLKEGDAINLFQNPRARASNSKIVKSYKEIGKVRIIRTHAHVSTAYILNSNTEVRIGDLAGVIKLEPGSGQGIYSDPDDLTLD